MSNPTPEDTDVKLPLDNGTDTMNSVTGEREPCLEDGTKNGTDDKKEVRRGWRQRTETNLQDKSGLSKRGLYIAAGVLLALFVLLLIVIVLAACWPRTPHERQYPVCADAPCLRAVAQIREGLNTSISPCNDIWQWGCQNWLQSHSLSPEMSYLSLHAELYKQDAVRVRSLVATMPVPLETSSVRWKVKHLYDSCMEVDNVEADGIRPLSKTITELGGWHVLREWSVQTWDFRRVLERLHAKYGATPFFKVTVVPNPRSQTMNIIKIEPSGLGLPDKSFYDLEPDNKMIESYKRFIRDVLIIFKATTSDAAKFSNDMFHFEKRLAEITPNTAALQNLVSTNNIISVSEFKITAPSLPLREILVAMFPHGKITDDTDVLVPSIDYLTSVSELISNTDRSALNNYFIWTLVRQYVPYLSSDVVAELHAYTAELTGVRKPLPRWETCTRTLRRFVGFAVESLLEQEDPLTAPEIELVQDMFEYIRTTTKSRISSMNYPPELERHLNNKLSSMDIQIGLPKHVIIENYLKKYYEKMYVQKSNLFHNIENGFDFLSAEQENRYIEPQPEDSVISSLTIQKPETVYSPSTNTIIVPRIFLKEPFFHYKYPRSVNFGRLGVEISTAVASSVLPYGSMWTGSAGLLTQYHPVYNESLSLIRNPMNCLSESIRENRLLSTELVNSTSLSSLIHLSAVNIAHQALLSSLNDNPHIHQATLENFEDSAMYFLTYTQSHCALQTQQHEFLENTVSFKLVDKSRLELTWRQIPEFASSVECDSTNPHCDGIL